MRWKVVCKRRTWISTYYMLLAGGTTNILLRFSFRRTLKKWLDFTFFIFIFSSFCMVYCNFVAFLFCLLMYSHVYSWMSTIDRITFEIFKQFYANSLCSNVGYGFLKSRGFCVSSDVQGERCYMEYLTTGRNIQYIHTLQFIVWNESCFWQWWFLAIF